VTAYLKRLASHLPLRAQQELRRGYCAWRVHRGRFVSEEPEYRLLGSLLRAGDWVLDVGANVGTYTLLCSELVGPQGRVIALEPVPATFELLAANARLAPFENVTLLNAAASQRTRCVAMQVPTLPEGLPNHFMAAISEGAGDLTVLSLSIDALELPHPIRLAKIDAEGHELPVLEGMTELLERDRPLLVVEANSGDVADFLRGFGYAVEILPGSSNYVARHPGTEHARRSA
jgi:FkbM family methyltransferase